MPWDDAQVVVAHRRTLRRAVNVCRAHTKVAVLTSPGAGPAELALLLDGRPPHLRHLRGTRHRPRAGHRPHLRQGRRPHLARPQRRHRHRRHRGPRRRRRRRLDRRPRPGAPAPRGWALPAEAYGGATAARASREPLRAAQLARLGPRIGDLVWDIGCGSGAFAAEAARSGAAVIAVDRDPGPAPAPTPPPARFGVQLQIVHGSAPHVLEDLPEPDVVRVGGGGAAVVSAVADRRPQRIVTHAATRDEAELIGRDLTEHGYAGRVRPAAVRRTRHPGLDGDGTERRVPAQRGLRRAA